MIMSFMCVLFAFPNNENVCIFFANVFDKKIFLLKSLNNVENQYCVKKYVNTNIAKHIKKSKKVFNLRKNNVEKRKKN